MDRVPPLIYTSDMTVLFSGKQKLRPAILEEEDLAKTGMGAVLNMARRKGFLDQEEEGRSHLLYNNSDDSDQGDYDLADDDEGDYGENEDDD